ncbi:S1 RNA-binding domain-containing protein [Saccharopolyspora sp. K220]|uniref:S1 RNA-binding domain-containing protein n=1 Tax=Saccharopolyspora soli TaxID=2926618 RepID=UPI001F567694|nr:S1 RNA-binding domain-containing protein [Saccharopolyspora soli]MCI2416102.1 S1 RNA-binding domain-containing protein [Saccharopolyspora soli]
MSAPHSDFDSAAWDAFASQHASGDVVTGQVVSVVPFGAFVDVAGVHGLLHKVEWSDEPEVGAEIRVRIAEIDAERHRMSLRTA